MALSLLFQEGLCAEAGLAGLRSHGTFQADARFWESPVPGERSPTRPWYRTVPQLSAFSLPTSRLILKNLLKARECFSSHILVLQRTRWRVRQPESVVGTNFEELLM